MFFATLPLFSITSPQASGISWTTVVEVLSSVAGLGAFIWGIIRTYQAWVNRRTKKREAEEDVEIQKKIQAVVDSSVTKMLTRVDDIVHTSIADQLAVLDKKVEEVHNETHNNGGASMKDSQDRMETNITKLLTGQDTQRALLKNQDEKIEGISSTGKENGTAITELKIAMAAHIGAHVGLPEKGDQGDQGDRGDTGLRGDTGARGVPGKDVPTEEILKLRRQVSDLLEGQKALLTDMALNGGDTSSSRDALKRIEAAVEKD